MKNNIYFKILVSCLSFAAVLILSFSLTVGVKSKPVVEPEEKVPYKQSQAPLFWGLLMNFSGGKSVYFGFDAEVGTTSVILLPENAQSSEVSQYGYSVDCEVRAEFDFLSSFIDSFGGIELNTDSGIFSFTGVQITDMLKKTNDIEFKKRIINKLFAKIKVENLRKDHLSLLIENTETTLTFPMAYYLDETVNNAVFDIRFIN